MTHKSKITSATSPLFCNYTTLQNTTLLLISTLYIFECVVHNVTIL